MSGSTKRTFSSGSKSENQRDDSGESLPRKPLKEVINKYTISIYDMSRVIAKGSTRRMRVARRQLDLTQKKMAQALGVRTNTLARWERGKVVPPKVAELAVEYLLLKRKGRK